MARTFELGCDDCKVCLWIGQRPTAGRFYLYTAEPHRDHFESFLLAHQDHRLRFIDTEARPDDWRELSAQEEDPEVTQESPRRLLRAITPKTWVSFAWTGPEGRAQQVLNHADETEAKAYAAARPSWSYGYALGYPPDYSDLVRVG